MSTKKNRTASAIRNKERKMVMCKRIVALFLSLLLVIPIIPRATATETVSCLTVDSRLVIIGDSNTVFLKKNNSDIQPARIYARVSATIQETVNNYNYYADGYNYNIYSLINALDGSTFDTVVINMGTNNLGSSIDNYKSNYTNLLNKLYGKNPNAVIYCCKILPINPNNYGGPYYDAITIANVNKINNAVVEVQQDFKNQGYDTRILDLNTPFSNTYGVLLSEYDSGGGIHLTTSGYKYMNKVIQTELAKGDVNANHSWVAGQVLQPATCTDDGLQQMNCSVCGAKKNSVIAATGHRWNAGTVTVAPTCTKAGTLTKTCTVCGAEVKETIPATGVHIWDDGVITEKATCVKAGSKVYTCTTCGSTKKETLPIDPNAHAWKLTEILTTGETYHSSTGLYTCSLCSATKTARLCAGEIFTDMPVDKNWAHDSIDWAYFNSVTAGTSPTTFSPNVIVTRGQAVSFLYAFWDKPDTDADNPFSDVHEKDYFYNPVRWACENEITAGTSETTFSPEEPCGREQIVTFLWAAAGRPEPTIEDCPFDDVSPKNYFYKAVMWACENGITAGIQEDYFGSYEVCTRAQMVTFLRAMEQAVGSQAEPEEP